LKKLRQVTVIGLGLLGGSISLAICRSLSGIKTVGYSHRASTRDKARQLGVADEILDDMGQAVRKADLVILSTPVFTFEGIFSSIASEVRRGCIVTDVGSTKVLPHRWAKKLLPGYVQYVGSHPIAGSEQRGVEFARDDLFENALCILTRTKKTSQRAIAVLKGFWSALGCRVELMTAARHDRILAKVSHLPHIAAAALVNACSAAELKYAGRGFIDTSRIASGPANIWTDVLLSNAGNITKGIDEIVNELLELKKAVKNGEGKKVKRLLEAARRKRNAL